MRRQSIVVAVAALDAFLHRLVVERAYTHDELPGALARLDVPFQQLLEQADETKKAARSAPHNSRPRVAIKRQLRDRLLRETFQGYKDVARALGMAGRSRNWDAIGQQMNPPLTPVQIRSQLNAIVTRRNQIVHEGDYRRLEKPQNATRNLMTYTQAATAIDFLAQLVDAINAVV
jgi:ribosome modulation factor